MMASIESPKTWIPSIGSPKTWIPYVKSKDCSQGFCSLYCPQWCYIIFPPPPPPPHDLDHSSNPTFSPLLIAIIGILVSALLLITYYTLLSKYCGNTRAVSRGENQDQEEGDLDEEEGEIDQNPILPVHEPWLVSATGLDEALIKRITMFKYKKGDGLIEGTDCSVCLNEFEEDECLRLLPKCSHAFHVYCIDTWLGSHSSCPLCRANIVLSSSSSLPPPPPPPPVFVHDPPPAAQDGRPGGVSDEEVGIEVENDPNSAKPDTVIQIRDEEGQQKQIRRSFSMDHPCFGSRGSSADGMRMNDEEYMCWEEGGSSMERRKVGGRRKRMKRSFSSGRFCMSGRRGRMRETVSASDA